MALVSTQPLTEMSTSGISWGGGGVKGGRCVGLTTLPPPYADFVKVLRASNFWNAQGLPTDYYTLYKVSLYRTRIPYKHRLNNVKFHLK